MGKKQQRFRDIWVNQTELGRHFGMSAVAVGKKLIEMGLRTDMDRACANCAPEK